MDTGNLLASAGEMQALDRKTIEEIGIPGAVLMENAGRATVAAMEWYFKPATGQHTEPMHPHRTSRSIFRMTRCSVR